MKLADFDILQTLGHGSYATVYKAVHRFTGKVYALKELSKSQLIRLNKVENVYREREVLQQLRHPHIVKLYATFQSELFLCKPYFDLIQCRFSIRMH